VILYNFRLRVIGFPLNLWVGSSVGLRIGTQYLPSTSWKKFHANITNDLQIIFSFLNLIQSFTFAEVQLK
jgi:hypothetical protein